jgi:putative hemin transport protein
MNDTLLEPSLDVQRQTFLQHRSSGKLRHRDAAHAMNLAEAQSLALFVGEHVLRLNDDFSGLIERCGELGEVMALTRNDACVHERVGEYLNVSHSGQMGMALGDEIDLRIFYSRWKSAFAVSEITASGTQRSLQFFDAHGDAVHKIFLRETSRLDAWMLLTEEFACEDQVPGLEVTPRPAKPMELPDGAIDVAGLQAAWRGMLDTHQFFGLLSKFKVSRTQALRLGPPECVQNVPLDAARRVLNGAVQHAVPIMVFVGNPGMIQIHSGPIANVQVMGPWLNVLDTRFNLHLREDAVALACMVKKPTSDGIVTSLELFDAQGETIAMLFGKRKPGIPENLNWRELMAHLWAESA